MSKEVYEAPEVEIIRFQTEDVIETSGGGSVGEGTAPFSNWG